MRMFLVSMIVALLGLSGNAFAQEAVSCTPGVTQLRWAENTEADLAKYSVYMSKDGGEILATTEGGGSLILDVQKGAGSADGSVTVLLPSESISEESDYWFMVTASDVSGNESTPSEVVSCNVNLAPGAPTGVQILSMP